MRKKIKCMSTHGGAGYGFGQYVTTYWDKEDHDKFIKAEMTCPCGYRGHASATGARTIYYTRKENFWKWLFGKEKGEIPTWPDWLGITYKYI